jgi:hypothetical protein
MKLPTVRGSNLLRQKMVFPRDFAGEINLVFIAFLRRHQDVIDEWVPFVQQLAQEYPQLHYYEFPTLPGKGPLYQLFLNEGMRAGIPSSDTRSRTITLYLNKDKFRAALDIESEDKMWIYLFDQAGEMLWRTNGRFSPTKAENLRLALLNLNP